MSAEELLLEYLEDLLEEDFKKFKWFLSTQIFDHCKPIPRSKLQNASQTDTVDKMMEYGEETAMKLAVEIFSKMRNNNAAEKLKSKYAGVKNATASTSSSAAAPPAAPTVSASNGAVIFAPNIGTGCTTGQWTVNFNTKQI